MEEDLRNCGAWRGIRLVIYRTHLILSCPIVAKGFSRSLRRFSYPHNPPYKEGLTKEEAWAERGIP